MSVLGVTYSQMAAQPRSLQSGPAAHIPPEKPLPVPSSKATPPHTASFYHVTIIFFLFTQHLFETFICSCGVPARCLSLPPEGKCLGSRDHPLIKPTSGPLKAGRCLALDSPEHVNVLSAFALTILRGSFKTKVKRIKQNLELLQKLHQARQPEKGF